MIDLTGKTALVTGAGRGIGEKISLQLAEAGADLCISDIDEETANQTSEKVKGLGRESIAVKSDVSNSNDVNSMVKTMLEKFSKIDILVNNAGITRDNLIMRMKEEDWDSVLDINLKSAFLCSKACIRPMMKQRSGKIINISSIVGIIGNAGQANYSSSKAGLIGLTKTLARELAPRSVNVNAIAPGFIRSQMTDKLSEENRKQYEEQIPMKALGEQVDIANCALFLASSLSDYITGEVITVDGGLVM